MHVQKTICALVIATGLPIFCPELIKSRSLGVMFSRTVSCSGGFFLLLSSDFLGCSVMKMVARVARDNPIKATSDSGIAGTSKRVRPKQKTMPPMHRVQKAACVFESDRRPQG